MPTCATPSYRCTATCAACWSKATPRETHNELRFCLVRLWPALRLCAGAIWAGAGATVLAVRDRARGRERRVRAVRQRAAGVEGARAVHALVQHGAARRADPDLRQEAHRGPATGSGLPAQPAGELGR